MADTNGVIVMPDPMREFLTAVFAAHGLQGEHAATVADHLVEADLRGVYSHGIVRIESYTARIRAGAMNLRPEIRVIRETSGTALVPLARPSPEPAGRGTRCHLPCNGSRCP